MRYKVETEKVITPEEVERLVKAGTWKGTYTPAPEYNESRSGEREQSQQQPRQ